MRNGAQRSTISGRSSDIRAELVHVKSAYPSDSNNGIVDRHRTEKRVASGISTGLSVGASAAQFATGTSALAVGGAVLAGAADDDEVKHHSAFLAGQPVAAAGLWGVKNGQLTRINSESGHYQPPGDYCEQILQERRSVGPRSIM